MDTLQKAILVSTESLRVDEQRLREFVTHELIRPNISKKKSSYNRICAAMDVIGDTTLALRALAEISTLSKHEAYLVVHGAFQSMSILLAGCNLIAKELGVMIPEPFLARFHLVQDIRTTVSGHPFDHQKNTRTGRQAGASGISRITLNNRGFSLHSWLDDGTQDSKPVSTLKWAQESIRIARLYLRIINCQLDRKLKAKCHKWMRSPLSNYLSTTLYYCEKINFAYRSNEYAFMKGLLESISDQIAKLSSDKQILGHDYYLFEEHRHDFEIASKHLLKNCVEAKFDVHTYIYLKHYMTVVVQIVQFCTELDSGIASESEKRPKIHIDLGDE